MAEISPQSSKLGPEDVSKISFSANDGSYFKEPLSLTGALEKFKQFDVTPVIGTEFQDVNLIDWMVGKNSDALLRDLAITSTTVSSTVTRFN